MSSSRHFIIAFLSFTVVTVCTAQESLVIETSAGKVHGKTVDANGKSVEAYLGIPFGEAPVGKLRFRKPVAKEPWDGVWNATEFGAGCYLSPDRVFGDFWGSDMWNPTVPLDEDCLNLNVWTPSPRPTNAAVIVWIFGGGFYSGVSSLELYDGRWMTAQEDVIVVSMNYRIGAFGFLTLGDESAPGNQGLWDQALALQWVQDNIALFGGNPKSVTLWGESAGAVSVSHHMLSPVTSDLFHRGILQSSASTAPWAYFTLDEGIRRSRVIAGLVGCDAEGTNEEVIACLEGVDPKEILNNQFAVYATFLDFPFIPVIDGEFLLEIPSVLYKEKNFKDADILIGTNLNEAMFFMIYEVPNFFLTNDTLFEPPSEMTRDDYRDSLKYSFRNANYFAQDAIAFQYTDWLDPEDPDNLRYGAEAAAGDYFFTCSTYDMARAWSSAGNNVYYYRFLELASASPWPEWMGVLHGDEIAYAFGYPLNTDTDYPYSEEEKLLSQKMMRYWANFAKSGDPNSPNEGDFNGPEWPLYTYDGQEFLALDEDINKDISKIGRGPRANECALWREYLPKLEAETAGIKEDELAYMEEFRRWRSEFMGKWKEKFDDYIKGKGCNN